MATWIRNFKFNRFNETRIIGCYFPLFYRCFIAQNFTADDVERAAFEERVDVGRRPTLGDGVQLAAEEAGVGVEDGQELVQDLKVEGRGQQPPPPAPPGARGQQQALAQPRQKKVVNVALHPPESVAETIIGESGLL